MAAVKICLSIAVMINIAQASVQLRCAQNLPKFVDQGEHSPGLLVGIQALVPTYQFSCHGKVTRWGIATERQGKHSIYLQVWRTTGRHHEFPVYTLVGANKFDIEPPKSRILYYISPSTMDQITVQPGDVIGFYLQNNASIEDDFTIQYNPHANNVTLQFVMSDEPLAVIEETTLSVQMLKTAPVVTVDIAELFISTMNYPKSIAPSQTVKTSSFIHQYTSIEYSCSKFTIYSTHPDGFGSVPVSIYNSIPTTAILLVTLGILIIAVVLGIIGVVIACRKSQPLNRSEERYRQSERTQLTLTGKNEQNMETRQPEPTLQKNPAYYQGTILMSSSNHAHDYETPITFQAEENYIVMSSHDYNVPRKLHEYQSHDYEEV